MKVNPFHLLLWTFRRNDNDVVSLYNTLSPMMQLITDNNMLNFGYWEDENITPDQAQNKLCDLVGRTAELDTASTLLDIGSGLSSPAIEWSTKYPSTKISCVNINFQQLKFGKEYAKEKIPNLIHQINSTSTLLPFSENSIERIIALESAQHFKPFSEFISESHRVLKDDGILTFAIPVMKKKSNPKNLGILKLTWSSEHYHENFIINATEKKFDIVEKLEIGSYVFEPLTNYYLKNREKLRDILLTQYPSYVEKILYNSLLKMKNASEQKLIEYFVIKCLKNN